ncbi:hypothetical protein AB0M28_10740 [Streptomyces sp. NPDC051940]|uniref:hypothetical protein n=1 Tax=Streptomyces sp. NPDC051940 TaxID=3155675 RepID=UPI0034373614
MITMCSRCQDVERTVGLVDDLSTYTATSGGPDWDFAHVVGWALGLSYVLAVSGPEYPPTGHTFPPMEK